MNKSTKKEIQRLVESELEKALLEEGLTDWLKKGVQAATSAWNTIKGKLSAAADRVQQILQQKLQQVKQLYPQALQQYKEIKALEAQAGQKMPVDNVMKIAMQLPAEGKAAIAEVQAERNAVQNAAQKLNVPNQKQQQQAQATAQEAYAVYATTLLSETASRYEKQNKQALNEQKLLTEVDPFGVVGLGLGIIGGLPLLLKGLYKFASFLKMQKTAEFFKKVYTVAHHLEEKAIDYIVPDKLSYLYYKQKYSMTRTKGQAPPLPYQEYVKSDVRKKVEKQMYTIMLIPFLLHGVSAVAHAGLSLIGAAEGAATTVKAVEIGKEIMTLAGQATKA